MNSLLRRSGIAVAPADKVQGVSRHCQVRRRANRTLFNFVIGESGFYPSAPGVWRANSAPGQLKVSNRGQIRRPGWILRFD